MTRLEPASQKSTLFILDIHIMIFSMWAGWTESGHTLKNYNCMFKVVFTWEFREAASQQQPIHWLCESGIMLSCCLNGSSLPLKFMTGLNNKKCCVFTPEQKIFFPLTDCKTNSSQKLKSLHIRSLDAAEKSQKLTFKLEEKKMCLPVDVLNVLHLDSNITLVWEIWQMSSKRAELKELESVSLKWP